MKTQRKINITRHYRQTPTGEWQFIGESREEVKFYRPERIGTRVRQFSPAVQDLPTATLAHLQVRLGEARCQLALDADATQELHNFLISELYCDIARHQADRATLATFLNRQVDYHLHRWALAWTYRITANDTKLIGDILYSYSRTVSAKSMYLKIDVHLALEHLDDKEQHLAIMLMQGYDHHEICRRLHLARRTEYALRQKLKARLLKIF